MATILRNHDALVKAVGGIDDHVHLLFQLPAPLALSKAVYLVKTFSSKWMKQFVNDFDWQEGYGAFSYSKSQISSVAKYIENQEKHHSRQTFTEEHRKILDNFGIEYDNRYIFHEIE